MPDDVFEYFYIAKEFPLRYNSTVCIYAGKYKYQKKKE